MSKVSDFKLASAMLKKICRKNNVSFIDIPVSFYDDNEGCLLIGETKNIGHTVFKIIAQYIEKSFDITGKDLIPDQKSKKEFLISLASSLRSLIYGDEMFDENHELHYMRLYQFPLVWILLKDIICPIYKKDLFNIKIVCGENSQIDISHFCKKGENENIDEPFIFVNKIDNRSVQSAFVFIESLRAYDLSPIEVIKEIYESDLYEKFKGLLEIAFDNKEDVVDFECAIMAILGIDFYSLVSNKIASFNPKFVKTAQNSVPGLPNQFWFVGLLEKMLEPARGDDWSVY